MKNFAKLELSKTAKLIAQLKIGYLNKYKNNDELLNRDDLIWHLLLQSFSTWGGSYGWAGMIQNEENYNNLKYEKIKSINENERLTHLERVCRKAKVRMPPKKAKCILECFYQIEKIGGLKKVKQELFAINGRGGKIDYLKNFSGIGKKYARNMMMDIYHEDFRNSIAIDSRIKSISNSWGLEFKNYNEHENFYLEIANSAELNGWELDRLMYKYTEIFKKE
jgi:hypothetical protein